MSQEQVISFMAKMLEARDNLSPTVAQEVAEVLWGKILRGLTSGKRLEVKDTLERSIISNRAPSIEEMLDADLIKASIAEVRARN